MPKRKKTYVITSKLNASQRNGSAKSEDLHIEWDTSSSSSDEQQVVVNNQRDDSPIHISTFSSDDDDENEITRSLTAHCTPTGRYNSSFRSYVNRRSYSGSSSGIASDGVRRKPLPMKILKRKSLQLNSDEVTRSPLKVLSTRDNVGLETPPTAKSPSDISPWHRVRSVFTPLRRCTSSRNKETSELTIEACLIDNEEDEVVHRKCSQTIDSPTQPSTQLVNQPSELDLFVALLERETAPTPATRKLNECKKKKRCPKGSYMYHLQRILECARTDRKFLMHDKKFGLCSGQVLRVVKIEETFGVHLVTAMPDSAHCEPTELEQELHTSTVNSIILVVDANLAVHLRIGSRLEQFFKLDLTPYAVQTAEGKNRPVYVQPNKLLLLD